ncbi:MAG: hypothetical protein QM754_12010 [Tepidisphaeraceae bacterium]
MSPLPAHFRRPRRRTPVLLRRLRVGFAPAWPITPAGDDRRPDAEFKTVDSVAAVLQLNQNKVHDAAWSALVTHQVQHSPDLAQFMRFTIGPAGLVRAVGPLIEAGPVMPAADGRTTLNVEQAELVTATTGDWLKSIWIDAYGWLFEVDPPPLPPELFQ